MTNRLQQRRLARLGPGAILPDAVTLLTVYLVVLYAIPSNQVVADLGSAGTVGVLFGLAGAILWTVNKIQGTDHERPTAPVRYTVTVFLFVSLVSYVVAMTRPLPAQELSIADTGLIRLVAWAGILFLAHDGISSMERLTVLLRRLVVASGLLAALGVTQFFTRLSITDMISIPGLRSVDTFAAMEVRGGLIRAAGTSNHPLEYSLVLAMALPLAVTLALRDTERSLLLRWIPVGLIFVGLTLSGSRSAIIGIVAGIIVLFPVWSARIRWGLALSSVAAVGMVYAIAPRVITNMRYMFLSILTDPSATSRTDSLGVFSQLFAVSPVFGRGFGTLLPEYRIFDNQYLLLVIETGILGLAAFLLVFLVAIVGAIRAARRVTDQRVHDLGFALAAAASTGAVLLFLFDALSFPQSAGTVFLILGLCGAYRRLSRDDSSPAEPSVDSRMQENPVNV